MIFGIEGVMKADVVAEEFAAYWTVTELNNAVKSAQMK